MSSDDRGPATLIFGDFRLDAQTLELHKDGMRVRLRQQPARLLARLARRSGELVTREELQQELWGAETFVDFERGLNNCVKQIREALNDNSDTPKYIETLPRRGYRFLLPVKIAETGNGSAVRTDLPVEQSKAGPTQERRLSKIWFWAAAGALAICGVGGWALIGHPALLFHERDSVLISDFENHTGDPRFDDALRMAFTVSLQQSRYVNVIPRGRINAALERMGKPGKRVTTEVGREICEREGVRGLITADITRTGEEYELTAELIDPTSGNTVRSYSERVHGEDHILDSLDRVAGKIRADLGESLYRIQQADRPLPRVTTASLEALKDYADGSSLWYAAKYKDAVSRYNAAIVLDPDFAMAHVALGEAYCSYIFNYQRERGRQEYQKALSLTSRVTERERRLIELEMAASLDHVEEADRLYRLYLADYPDDSLIREDFGRLLRMHGRGEEALKQYQEVLRIAPNNAKVEIDLATTYISLDQPAEAVRAYSEGFRLDPAKLSVGTLNREYGFALIASGDARKAEETYTTFASNPDHRASGLDSLGMMDLLYGRYARARGRFEESLRISEQAHDVFLVARNHFFLAVVAGGEGNKARQMKELDAALADFKNLGPKVEYGSLVGQEYARAGAIAKAEELEKRIAPLADTNSEEQNGYVRLLGGEIALAKGDAAEAAKLLDLQDPRYGTGSVVNVSRESMARAYDKAGNQGQAIAQYETVTGKSWWCHLYGWEPQQRCPEAFVALSNVYLARGDKQKAAAALEPLLKYWKDADADLPLKKQILELQSKTAN